MARRNPRSGGRDMVISMTVLIVPVLLIMAFFARPGDEQVKPVDVQSVLTKARAEASYPVLAVANVREGWTPVRVRWAKAGSPWLNHEPAAVDSWQVGYLNPDHIYYGVQQRAGQPAGFVDKMTRTGRSQGKVDVAGRSWVRYVSADGRTRSLVHKSDRMTVIISADTDDAHIIEFASTLSS